MKNVTKRATVKVQYFPTGEMAQDDRKNKGSIILI